MLYVVYIISLVPHIIEVIRQIALSESDDVDAFAVDREEADIVEEPLESIRGAAHGVAAVVEGPDAADDVEAVLVVHRS